MKENTEKKPFNKKKLKYGTMATVITIFVIAIVVFINLIAGVLTEKKGLKLDLTSEKYFDVSQDTIDYIRGIDKDVAIEVFTPKNDLENNTYYKMVVETLAKYEQNSDHIKVNYYDITKNPEVVNKYTASYNGDLRSENIVIASGDRVKVTSITALFNTQSDYNTGSSSIKSYKGEQEITSAVMNVTNANPINVGVITSYNGQSIYHSDLNYDLSNLVQLLEKNGYDYKTVDILSDDLSPDDYDMLILPAPVNDLTEDSVKKLEDFLYNGGKLDKDLIYIADILQRKTPNIDAFLEVWGIRVGGNQVIESENNRIQQVNIVRNSYGMAQQAKAPVVDIDDSSYSEGLSNTKLPIVAPAARNIEVLFDTNVDRTVKSLLKTAGSAVLYPLNMQESQEITLDASGGNGSSDSEDSDDSKDEESTEASTGEAAEETTQFDPSSAEKGENTVMALATKTAADGNVTHENNVLVMGSASFADPYVTGVATFNNAEFVVNAINKMCGKENSVIIAEKNFESTAIDVTETQAHTIRNVLVFGLPFVIVVIGVVVFIRRKNK